MMKRAFRFVMLTVAVSGIATAVANPLITLHQGGNLSLSMPADASRLVFELAGSIWSMDPGVGRAEALTGVTEHSRHPAISADGRRIAYESMRDGYYQIMLIDAAGGTPEQVTFGPYHHLSPAWSPDGLRLAIASDRAGNFDIWQLDITTSALRQLTYHSKNDREPNWNDSGTTLAFVRDDGAKSSLLSVRPGAEPRVLLTEQARIYGPSWRPGGGVLTYVRRHDSRSQLRMLLLSRPAITKPITHGERVDPFAVRWIDRQHFYYVADGSVRRREFGTPAFATVPLAAQIEIRREPYAQRKQDFDDIDSRPATGVTGLSPTGDGRLIASALGDLWELDADGTLLRQLTNDAFVDGYPAVSSDGNTLAFVSDRSGTAQIWLMDIASGTAQRLTVEKGMALYPAWDPKSDTLAYLLADNAAASNLTLKRVDVRTRNIEVLAEHLSVSAPPFLDGDDWLVPSLNAEVPQPEESPLPLSWRPFRPKGRYIVRAGRIFDGFGPGYLARHEIVIEDHRIVQVRPWTRDDKVPVIDATKHTVIPGLIDLSVRQAPTSDERLGRAWLASGVTTVRETVSNLPEAIERHESWRSGRRIGPRLYLAVDPCPWADDPAGSPYVERLIAGTAIPYLAGIELCETPGTNDNHQFIETAHAAGLPVTTALPYPGLLLGADEIRFAGPVQSTDPMQIQTNGVSYSDIGNIVGQLNTTIVSRLGLAADARAAGRDLLRVMGQGAQVVTGSGAPRTPYGLGLQTELRLLADAGLQSFQILKMTTLDAARVLGAGDDLGAIQAGKLADLVIVDGDPLADISHTANVVFTIINGRPYAIRELERPGGRAQSVGNFYN
jgi:Tol biopolymer transport system component